MHMSNAYLSCVSSFKYLHQILPGGVAETRIIPQCGKVQNMTVIQGNVILP